MPWNRPKETKSIQGFETKVSPGAPVAYNTGAVGKPYRDNWDIDRAYREGVARVTWVFRCIDAIAGNQARLPVILRKGNTSEGAVVLGAHKIKELLNTAPNEGENSFVFRYRLSAQLLMGTRGAFIEVIRDRTGEPQALHLLPPGSTAPLPDPKKFVSGFQVDLPNGTKEVLAPDKVIWVRRPHPLNPYLSITPMEAAGVAIEIETLAKLYNRNFLLNDGRPGGLLVLRGEVSDEDKDELRSRFVGNINRSGAVGVIASDDGAEFIDTGSSPRDAAYIQMRTLTKEEILACFGVPESIIGNASGRTFANAKEEGKVFWNETMMPHLDLIARGFDALDTDLWVGFDTDTVPALILAKQDRSQFYLREKQAGLISINEYRVATGREKVKSELADALLDNPNLTPTGNTEKATPTAAEQQQRQPGATPLDMAGGAPVPVIPTAPPGQKPWAPGESNVPPGLAGAQPGAPALPAPAGGSPQTLAESIENVEYKRFDFGEDWGTKTAEEVERWGDIIDNTLERFFERQQRVVLEKASGAKARKQLAARDLGVAQIFDESVWNRQIREDMQPLLAGVMTDAAGLVSEKAVTPVDIQDNEEMLSTLELQLGRLESINSVTAKELAAAVAVASVLMDDSEEDAPVDDKVSLLKTAIASIFVAALMDRKKEIAQDQAWAAHNAGAYFAGREAGAGVKIWHTVLDEKVRPEHRAIHGRTVPVGAGFKMGDYTLRFPHDPLAPAHLTVNCRCYLSFDD